MFQNYTDEGSLIFKKQYEPGASYHHEGNNPSPPRSYGNAAASRHGDHRLGAKSVAQHLQQSNKFTPPPENYVGYHPYPKNNAKFSPVAGINSSENYARYHAYTDNSAEISPPIRTSSSENYARYHAYTDNSAEISPPIRTSSSENYTRHHPYANNKAKILHSRGTSSSENNTKYPPYPNDNARILPAIGTSSSENYTRYPPYANNYAKILPATQTSSEQENKLKNNPPVFDNRFSRMNIQRELLVRSENGFLDFLNQNSPIILKNVWEREIIPRNIQLYKENVAQSSEHTESNMSDAEVTNYLSKFTNGSSCGPLDIHLLEEQSKQALASSNQSQSYPDKEANGLVSSQGINDIVLNIQTHSRENTSHKSPSRVGDQDSIHFGRICAPSLISEASKVVHANYTPEIFGITVSKGINKSFQSHTDSDSPASLEKNATLVPNTDVNNSPVTSSNTVDSNLKRRCRHYLASGRCLKTDCKYLHLYPKEDNILCNYFLQGYCKWSASDCLFKHGEQMGEQIVSDCGSTCTDNSAEFVKPVEGNYDTKLSSNTVDSNLKHRCRRYLASGRCLKTDCKYLHVYPKEDNILCNYFLQGYCKWSASDCLFKHGEQKGEQIVNDCGSTCTDNSAELEESIEGNYDTKLSYSVGKLLADLKKYNFQTDLRQNKENDKLEHLPHNISPQRTGKTKEKLSPLNNNSISSIDFTESPSTPVPRIHEKEQGSIQSPERNFSKANCIKENKVGFSNIYDGLNDKTKGPCDSEYLNSVLKKPVPVKNGFVSQSRMNVVYKNFPTETNSKQSSLLESEKLLMKKSPDKQNRTKANSGKSNKVSAAVTKRQKVSDTNKTYTSDHTQVTDMSCNNKNLKGKSKISALSSSTLSKKQTCDQTCKGNRVLDNQNAKQQSPAKSVANAKEQSVTKNVDKVTCVDHNKFELGMICTNLKDRNSNKMSVKKSKENIVKSNKSQVTKTKVDEEKHANKEKSHDLEKIKVKNRAVEKLKQKEKNHRSSLQINEKGSVKKAKPRAKEIGVSLEKNPDSVVGLQSTVNQSRLESGMAASIYGKSEQHRKDGNPESKSQKKRKPSEKSEVDEKVSDHSSESRLEKKRKPSEKSEVDEKVSVHSSESRLEKKRKPSEKSEVNEIVSDHSSESRLEKKRKPSEKSEVNEKVSDHSSESRLEKKKKPSEKSEVNEKVSDHSSESRLEKKRKPSEKSEVNEKVSDHSSESRLEKKRKPSEKSEVNEKVSDYSSESRLEKKRKPSKKSEVNEKVSDHSSESRLEKKRKRSEKSEVDEKVSDHSSESKLEKKRKPSEKSEVNENVSDHSSESRLEKKRKTSEKSEVNEKVSDYSSESRLEKKRKPSKKSEVNEKVSDHSSESRLEKKRKPSEKSEVDEKVSDHSSESRLEKKRKPSEKSELNEKGNGHSSKSGLEKKRKPSEKSEVNENNNGHSSESRLEKKRTPSEKSEMNEKDSDHSSDTSKKHKTSRKTDDYVCKVKSKENKKRRSESKEERIAKKYKHDIGDKGNTKEKIISAGTSQVEFFWDLSDHNRIESTSNQDDTNQTKEIRGKESSDLQDTSSVNSVSTDCGFSKSVANEVQENVLKMSEELNVGKPYENDFVKNKFADSCEKTSEVYNGIPDNVMINRNDINQHTTEEIDISDIKKESLELDFCDIIKQEEEIEDIPMLPSCSNTSVEELLKMTRIICTSESDSGFEDLCNQLHILWSKSYPNVEAFTSGSPNKYIILEANIRVLSTCIGRGETEGLRVRNNVLLHWEMEPDLRAYIDRINEDFLKSL